MVHSNDDAMNKIPLKSASGLDDEEKNGGEFIHDTATAEEARREQMRANILKWMKKLTIVLICFIGIALISYVIISLCFSDMSDYSNNNTASLNSTSQNGSNNNNTVNAIMLETFGRSDKHAPEAAVTTNSPPTTIDISANSPTPTVGGSAGAAVNQATASISNNPSTATTTSLPQLEQHMLQDVPITDSKFESKLGVYEQAAVCSDKEVCSQIGSNILEQGGTAVDAAISTMLCNGIVNMHSMGIGGGTLMNIYLKDEKHAYSIDAREVAPFAAYPEMFDGKYNQSYDGGLAIAVPGEMMGYHRAHERFGKLPWKALIEPSIKLCNEGYYLSKHQFKALQYHQKTRNGTVRDAVFVSSVTGELYPIGTKLKPQKELCETYALLAKNGPMDFYNGTLAKLIAEDLKDLGSTITLYDLESYSADLVSSITMQLGDDILYSMPPVSSGVVVANILSILEGYNFTKADLKGAENEATTAHRIVEALKFGFAKRWELGDLRFNDVRELVSKLTSPDYGQDIRTQINDSKVLNDISDYGAQFMGVDDVGTSHASILAPNGDAVSLTSSINYYFGAGHIGKRTGIVFNNCMNDFSVAGTANYFGLPPATSNFIDARKRPMSSMSPMLLADQKGDIRMALGAAGGSKIISGVAEVAARVLWFGQNIKEAIDMPRYHHQLVPDSLEYEEGAFGEEVLKLLAARGHKLKPLSDVFSVACGIVRNETAIYANADYRKRGGVAGF